MDSTLIKQRQIKKLNIYRNEKLPVYHVSEIRVEYLKKTIEFLKNYGSVYLVRLPTHPEMYEIEEKYLPNFKEKIKNIIPLTKGYFDMTSMNNKFTYTDGNHLYKESGKEVSLEIANWINENSKAQFASH